MSYVEAILSAWDLLVICMMNFIRDLLCISSSGESKMLRGRHPIRGIFVFHVKDGGNRCSAVCNRIGSVLEALGCRFHPRPSELTIQRCCNYTSDLIPGQGTLLERGQFLKDYTPAIKFIVYRSLHVHLRHPVARHGHSPIAMISRMVVIPGVITIPRNLTR